MPEMETGRAWEMRVGSNGAALPGISERLQRPKQVQSLNPGLPESMLVRGDLPGLADMDPAVFFPAEANLPLLSHPRWDNVGEISMEDSSCKFPPCRFYCRVRGDLWIASTLYISNNICSNRGIFILKDLKALCKSHIKELLYWPQKCSGIQLQVDGGQQHYTIVKNIKSWRIV